MKLIMLSFLLFSGLLVKSQTTIVSNSKRVKCILPTSVCEVTEVKNAADNSYVGKQIIVYLPFYSYDAIWYWGGMATLIDGHDASIGEFKCRLISQPSLSVNQPCLTGAQTAEQSFGFAAGVKVQILAVGALDKEKYLLADKYKCKVYKTYTRVTPIDNCWFAGILEADGYLTLFECIQLKRVDENEAIQKTPTINSMVEKTVTATNNSYTKKATFAEGMAVVSNDDKKYGYVDANNNVVVPLIYDYASDFQEGYGGVNLGERYGFVDKKGKIIIPLMYEKTGFRFNSGYVGMKLNGKWGFIDAGNKTVVNFLYDEVIGFFEGLAAVKLNEKWGYVDKTGKMVIPLKYDRTFRFSDGVASVKLNGKWGYINSKGEEEIAVIYDDLYWYKKGKAKVVVQGRIFFVDKTGKEVAE